MPSADLPRFAGLLPALTGSVEATEALGARLAERLGAGDILALHGDLGAGKTHLVRGLVVGLGGDPAAVTSPTFTLVHAYATPGPRVVHVDAYRLDGPDAFRRIGGDELLDDPGALTVIEWPERLGGLLPPSTVHLWLGHAGGDVREVKEGGDEGFADEG